MLRLCLSIMFYVLNKSGHYLPSIFEICEDIIARNPPCSISHLTEKILALREPE